jgi:hypothetical protein
MRSSVAQSARELETLILRAARRGVLDVAELLEAYVGLAPGNHPYLGDPRRVDLDAAVTALASLPQGLTDTREVLVVADLAGFAAEPVVSALLPAAKLPDGSLLVEGSFSLVSLVNLAAPLCLLAHEAAKAQRLLLAESMAPDEAESVPPAAVGPAESAPPVAAPPVATASADEPPLDSATVRAIIARLAFIWGVSERALEQAEADTQGALLRLLTGEVSLPPVRIHAALRPAAVRERGARAGERVAGALAEMGLAGRPLHLWIGNGVVSDCLSPYCRELRGVLTDWADQHPEQVGADLQGLTAAPGEDVLYALAHDFLRSDPALVPERDAADRTVGILRYAGNRFELIDLGRIDGAVCDARLAGLTVTAAPAPVLVRLAPTLEDQEGAAIESLVELLGPTIASVTVTLDGTALSAAPGAVVVPNVAVRWAGLEKVAIPGQEQAELEELALYADGGVRQGAVLSVICAALLAPAHVAELVRAFGVAGIEVGGIGTLAALAEARWRGQLQPAVRVRWFLVSSEAAATDRPTLATLRGHAAVAIATLRALAAPDPEAAPAPRPTRTRARGQSGRAVRIKA